jgi:hypothetical protein
MGTPDKKVGSLLMVEALQGIHLISGMVSA